MMRFICVYIIAVVFSVNVFAEEAILSFHSDITLAQNGLITVTETIEVNAENTLINRGIYRDFPTQYLGALLTKKEVGFKVLKVLRNGNKELFHTEKMSNGMRVYMGSSDIILDRGTHHYQLTYQTDNQMGYFDDYDEFYWNVTGTGWQFPILKASATIELPAQARQQVLDQQAWTGYQGEQNTDYKLTNSDQLLGFETTVVLNSYQGLTIGIQVPKGVFSEPPFDLSAFLAANLVWLLAILVSLFYLGFYLSAWYRHGRDPEPGVIMARFQPPKNLSPAAVHYIDNEAADDKTLTAGLLSLAVKGHITITQLKNQYRIKPLNNKSMNKLSKGERAIKIKLFKGKQTQVTLSKKPNPYLKAAKSRLNSVLRDEYKKKCFIDNSFYMIWGWLISVVCFFMVTLLIYSTVLSATDLIILIFFCLIILAMAAVFFIAAPIIIGLLVLLGMAFSYLEIFHLILEHKLWLSFTLFLIGLNLFFSYLLRSPTPFGRHIKDQIEGLKLYMKSAEEDRLDLMNPPEKTIEHYESLLPYAVALGLENQWANKFAALINTESSDTRGTVSKSYQPSWYQNKYNKNSSFSFSAASVSQSLTSSVAASTLIPSASISSSSGSYSGSSSSSSSSYSSGSSSSGSSGGGGGGGGGGGW